MISNQVMKQIIMRGIAQAEPCPDGYPDGTACPSCTADSILRVLHNHNHKEYS